MTLWRAEFTGAKQFFPGKGAVARAVRYGVQVLTVSYGYPQEQVAGPPFAVANKDMSVLFGAGFRVDQWASALILELPWRVQDAGMTTISEDVSRLVRL